MYKRQGDDDGNENAAVDLGAGEYGVQPQLRGGHAVEGGLIAGSYTHLDVYKRQLFGSEVQLLCNFISD